MRLTRIVVAALLLLSCGALTIAGASQGGGFGCFGPSLAFVDFADLNATFGRAGFEGKLEPMHWMFGGAGYGFVNRIVIGGSGWGGSQTISSPDLMARVSIAGGEFDLGYTLLSLPHLLVSPVLGIGGGGYTIDLFPNNSDVEDFDTLLAYPGRTSSASFSNLTLTPQLLVTIPVSFIGIQLRGGYAYSPISPEWELGDGGHLLSGPSVAKGAPFIGLHVCFGSVGGEKPARVQVRQRHTDDEEEDDDEDED